MVVSQFGKLLKKIIYNVIQVAVSKINLEIFTLTVTQSDQQISIVVKIVS
jgi:hypothetical protein